MQSSHPQTAASYGPEALKVLAEGQGAREVILPIPGTSPMINEKVLGMKIQK